MKDEGLFVADRDEDFSLANESKLAASDGLYRGGVSPEPPGHLAELFVLALQLMQLAHRRAVGPLRPERLGQSVLAEKSVHEQHACGEQHRVRQIGRASCRER